MKSSPLSVLIVVVVCWSGVTSKVVCGQPTFIRGELTGDGVVDPVDLRFLLAMLFQKAPQRTCQDAADVNDDGLLDLNDAKLLISYLLGAGAPLPPPFARCGVDRTADSLTCDFSEACLKEDLFPETPLERFLRNVANHPLSLFDSTKEKSQEYLVVGLLETREREVEPWGGSLRLSDPTLWGRPVPIIHADETTGKEVTDWWYWQKDGSLSMPILSSKEELAGVLSFASGSTLFAVDLTRDGTVDFLNLVDPEGDEVLLVSKEAGLEGLEETLLGEDNIPPSEQVGPASPFFIPGSFAQPTHHLLGIAAFGDLDIPTTLPIPFSNPIPVERLDFPRIEEFQTSIASCSESHDPARGLLSYRVSAGVGGAPITRVAIHGINADGSQRVIIDETAPPGAPWASHRDSFIPDPGPDAETTVAYVLAVWNEGGNAVGQSLRFQYRLPIDLEVGPTVEEAAVAGAGTPLWEYSVPVLRAAYANRVRIQTEPPGFLDTVLPLLLDGDFFRFTHTAKLSDAGVRAITYTAFTVLHSDLYGDGGCPDSVTASATLDNVEIKILTYNVQFRAPEIVDEFSPGWPNTEERAAAIGRAIGDGEYDIVGLNEAFHGERRSTIVRQAEAAALRSGATSRLASGRIFDVVWGPPNDEPGLFANPLNFIPGEDAYAVMNGGLTLLSRFPIISYRFHVYRNKAGEDSFAAKGVLHAVLWRGGSTTIDDHLHVFLTHLQASDSRVRDRQIAELADFIRLETALTPSAPVILMGDFNLDGDVTTLSDPFSSYSNLLAATRRARPDLVDLWPTLHPTELGATNTARSQRIDYVFLTQTLPRTPGVFARSIAVNEFPDAIAGHRGFLSDHAGVEAHLEWRSPAPRPTPMTSALRVAVAVTRLDALSEDACDEMEFYGSVRLTPGLAYVGLPRRPEIYSGNHVSPTNIKNAVRVLVGTPSVDATIRIREDDDFFCGGSDDEVDVNPLIDQTQVKVRIDLSDMTVHLLRRDDTIEGRIGSVGMPIVLRGTDGEEVAEMTFVALVQPEA